MKKLSTKIFTIFLLIIIALGSTIFASYLAVDTQTQHLVLTELLSKQKLLVERVTFTVIELGDVGLYHPEDFEARKQEIDPSLKQYTGDVDFMLNAFDTLEYPLGNRIVKLKFDEDFKVIFAQAIAGATERWNAVKTSIEYLDNPENLNDHEAYRKELNNFRELNKVLINDSDYITEICRAEAEQKKDFSTMVQTASFLLAGIVMLLLVYMIRRDFYQPLNQIRNTFRKMGKGDLTIRLERKSQDEFKEVFDDFNYFTASVNNIFSVESKLMETTNLSDSLTVIEGAFKDYADYDKVGVIFENVKGISQHLISENGVVSEVDCDHVDKITDTGITGKMIQVPIRFNSAVLGYVYFEYSNTRQMDRDIKFIKHLENTISFTFYKGILFKEMLAIVTDGLANLAESRDPETRKHLIRMSAYANIVAKKLYEKGYDGIDAQFIENILISAPMHDIGKVSVPDHILLKPGKLTDEEFDQMKIHTVEGGRVLEQIDEEFKQFDLHLFKMAKDIALGHQEKFNGSGYPNGLSGDDIPLAARIASVADVFDALTSKRPYKDAFSLEKSYAIIKESRGTHFDPNVVDTFFDAQEDIERVYHNFKEV